MWKVTKAVDGGLIVLLVSGRIEGEHLAELCNAFTTEAGHQNFVLDMKEVRLVDQDSVGFLSLWERSGAELRNCPAYIREWIEREKETKTAH